MREVYSFHKNFLVSYESKSTQNGKNISRKDAMAYEKKRPLRESRQENLKVTALFWF